MRFTVKSGKDKGLSTIISELNSIEQEPIIQKPKKKNPTEKKKDAPKGKRSKKKKKKDDVELLSVSDEGASTEHCEDKDIAKMMNLLDVDELMKERDEEDDSVSDPIIQVEKGSYKRRKTDPNEYKKEFAEEMTLLYDLLGDTTSITKKIKDFLDFDKKSIGGVSKSMSEMVSNLLSSQSTRLQIIKELSNIKKTAVDLSIKADARKAKESSGESMQHVASGLLHSIMREGRNNFVQSTRPVGYLPQDSYFGDGDDYEQNLIDMANNPGLTENDSYNLEEMVAERLRQENERMNKTGNTLGQRSEEADAYIRYENRNVEIKIELNTDTNEWSFFAVDQDGIVIMDYPLPNVEDVEPIRFMGSLARDSRGCQYKVVEYSNDDKY